MQQLLLGQLALRDVLHSAIELDDMAVPVPQGSPTGDDPDRVSLLVDDAGITFIGQPIAQTVLDGLGDGVPTLLGEVLFHLGIDGRGEGGITAIDAVDLR
ncbi:hypothetical protein D3C76_561610 [compost metagenome]